MKSKNNYLYIILLVICLYLLILYFQPPRFNKSMPVLFNIYPNSEEEVKYVEEAVANRTQEDVDFFKKTQYEFYSVFSEVIPEVNKKEFTDFVWKNVYIQSFIKLFFNRIRPYQINKKLNIIDDNIASYQSAFPSGHAFVSYSIANKYSKIYPERKELLYRLADKIRDVRIKGGYHYPSDGKFSYYLVHKYEKLFNIFI